MRPRSIVIFEACYLSGMVVGLANIALIWSNFRAMPEMTQMVARFPWYFPVTFGFGIAINLLLWFFAARRASVVAKWIIVVFFALSTLSLLLSLFRPVAVDGMRLIGAIVWVLNAVAVFNLFTTEARAWFAARGSHTTAASLNETFS